MTGQQVKDGSESNSNTFLTAMIYRNREDGPEGRPAFPLDMPGLWDTSCNKCEEKITEMASKFNINISHSKLFLI